jgi:hypothetical protein
LEFSIKILLRKLNILTVKIMKHEEILINHTISPDKPGIGPEIGYIHVRFPLDENYEPSADPKDIYVRSKRFEKFINTKVDFKVNYSVDPSPILDQKICVFHHQIDGK